MLPGDVALQCQTLATLLVPKVIEYLITNFDPSVTCKDVGICPGNALHDDFTCPVCQLVLNTTLHQALDPDTQVRRVVCGQQCHQLCTLQKQLHDAAHDACKLLQDDKVADCQARADEALNQLAAILRDVNPTHTCALLGLCSNGNGKTLRDVLMLARAKLQYVVMGAAAGQAHVRGDFCEACQIAVLEAAAFLADPQTQVCLCLYFDLAAHLCTDAADEQRQGGVQCHARLAGPVQRVCGRVCSSRVQRCAHVPQARADVHTDDACVPQYDAGCCMRVFLHIRQQSHM